MNYKGNIDENHILLYDFTNVILEFQSSHLDVKAARLRNMKM